MILYLTHHFTWFKSYFSLIMSHLLQSSWILHFLGHVYELMVIFYMSQLIFATIKSCFARIKPNIQRKAHGRGFSAAFLLQTLTVQFHHSHTVTLQNVNSLNCGLFQTWRNIWRPQFFRLMVVKSKQPTLTCSWFFIRWWNLGWQAQVFFALWSKHED